MCCTVPLAGVGLSAMAQGTGKSEGGGKCIPHPDKATADSPGGTNGGSGRPGFDPRQTLDAGSSPSYTALDAVQAPGSTGVVSPGLQSIHSALLLFFRPYEAQLRPNLHRNWPWNTASYSVCQQMGTRC